MSLALRLAKIIFAVTEDKVVVGGEEESLFKAIAMSEVDAGRDRPTPAAGVAL